VLRPSLPLFGIVLLINVASPPDATAQEDVSIRGTWHLHQLYEGTVDGEDAESFGPGVAGQLIATDNETFSLIIVSQRGRRFAATRPSVARAGGLIEAVGYVGRYRAASSAKTLTLHVIHCLYRNCDNSRITLDMALQQDTLELIGTEPEALTPAFYSRSIWRRHSNIDDAQRASGK
jgi:hypothetical protein